MPTCDEESIADEILENPGFIDGAGEAELLLGAADENPDGPGLSPFMMDCA